MDDGEPPHITRQMTALLRAHFGDEHVISRGFPTAWPPHFPNINRCDFWLWEFLKDNVNRGNIQIVPELKESITRHVSSIDKEALRATVCKRIEHVIEVNGMHIEQLCE